MKIKHKENQRMAKILKWWTKGNQL